MKPIEFKDKTAVITGAGSGMGLLAAKEFVRTGAAVVMCDINEDFFTENLLQYCCNECNLVQYLA